MQKTEKSDYPITNVKFVQKNSISVAQIASQKQHDKLSSTLTLKYVLSVILIAYHVPVQLRMNAQHVNLHRYSEILTIPNYLRDRV